MPNFRSIAVLLFLIFLAACARDKSNLVILPPVSASIGEARQIVPGPGLPENVSPQTSNNNLDIVRYQGRIYLAWRTAPTHFASEEVVMYIVSSDDEQTWRYEGEFSLNTDLREPGFLVVGEKLFFYFSMLGASSVNFEPGRVMVSEYIEPGSWTEPHQFFDDGFLAWRTKTIDGIHYVIGYIGGENIYDFSEQKSIDIYLLKTEDGYTPEPVVPGKPIIISGGGSETDFDYLDDGTLIGVSRNELGDETGFGMKICRAEADAIADWNCIGDKKKYDSPYVFAHRNEIYLIGRRNLTEDGFYDQGNYDLPPNEQLLTNELAYWNEPKRCSLWKIDPVTLEVGFILDLASRGDTCFPSVVKLDSDSYIVYNYSSAPEGPDYPWNKGQLNDTNIYREVITFK